MEPQPRLAYPVDAVRYHTLFLLHPLDVVVSFVRLLVFFFHALPVVVDVVLRVSETDRLGFGSYHPMLLVGLVFVVAPPVASDVVVSCVPFSFLIHALISFSWFLYARLDKQHRLSL